MRPVRTLYAAPAVRRALQPGASGWVGVVFGRGGYVQLGSDWLLLAEASAPFGPLSLVVDDARALDLRPGAAAAVLAGRLVVGGRDVSLERMRERAPLALRPSSPVTGSAALPRPAIALGEPPAALREGIGALSEGRIDHAVEVLAGRGEGLTPAGDDVLGGYAAWRFAVGDPVCLSAIAGRRCSPLGLAYLRAAERGELPDPLARFVLAVRAGSANAALPGVREWGASSGIAIAWGVVAGALRSCYGLTARR